MMRAAKIDLASRLRDTARVDPGRVPALAAVLADSAAHLAATLRMFTGLEVDAKLVNAAPHTDDALLEADGPPHRGAFGIGGALGLTAISSASLDRIVDAMFGGDGDEAADIRSRDLSPLERTVANAVLSAPMRALQTALDAVAPFSFERKDEEASQSPRAYGSWLGLRYELTVPGLTAALFALFPQSALQAFRNGLSREPKEAIATEDPAWAAAMRDEVARTALPVQAVLAEPGITLATLAGLQVGSVLALRATPRTAVALTCEGRTLFHGQFGQRDGIYTVRLGEAPHMDADG